MRAAFASHNIITHTFNTLRPKQDGRHFPDDIFKCIFLNENVQISIKISLKFVPKGPINNIPALVRIMAWRRAGDKPLSEPMMVSWLTHICVTRPQWVNTTTALVIASAGIKQQTDPLHNSDNMRYDGVYIWSQISLTLFMIKTIKHLFCELLNSIHDQGPVSISDKTSYCKFSRSLEAARFVFKIVRSLWNLRGTSAAGLSMRHMRHISRRCDDLHYQSRGFDTSRDLTMRRLFGYWNRTLCLLSISLAIFHAQFKFNKNFWLLVFSS